jgi:hypothetical protein
MYYTRPVTTILSIFEPGDLPTLRRTSGRQAWIGEAIWKVLDRTSVEVVVGGKV